MHLVLLLVLTTFAAHNYRVQDQKSCDMLGNIRVVVQYEVTLAPCSYDYGKDDSDIPSAIHGKDAALKALSHFVE